MHCLNTKSFVVCLTDKVGAFGVHSQRNTPSGVAQGAQFIDKQTKLAGGPKEATRPKSYSPRADFGISTSDDCQWLSTRRAARYLDTTPGNIRNMVWRGQLTRYKLPNGRLRFKKSELDKLLESSRKQGGFNGS